MMKVSEFYFLTILGTKEQGKTFDLVQNFNIVFSALYEEMLESLIMRSLQIKLLRQTQMVSMVTHWMELMRHFGMRESIEDIQL